MVQIRTDVSTDVTGTTMAKGKELRCKCRGVPLLLGCLMAWLSLNCLAQQEQTPTHVFPPESETHLVSRTFPELPPEAKFKKISGTVVLQLTISPLGQVQDARVISGHPLLAQTAVNAVRRWRYQPFIRNGVPVEATIEAVVQFLPPPPPQRFWPWMILFFGPWALLVAAWVRRIQSSSVQVGWRNRLVLLAMVLLSISLACLSAEVLYRYVAGQKLGLTPAVLLGIKLNGWICWMSGFLCLVGSGRGRFLALAAAPLLLFVWAIHVAV